VIKDLPIAKVISPKPQIKFETSKQSFEALQFNNDNATNTVN